MLLVYLILISDFILNSSANCVILSGNNSKQAATDYLIDPNFQGVDMLSVLSNKAFAQRTSYKWYFLPTVEIKD